MQYVYLVNQAICNNWIVNQQHVQHRWELASWFLYQKTICQIIEKHNVDSFMIICAFSGLNIMYLHVEQR